MDGDASLGGSGGGGNVEEQHQFVGVNSLLFITVICSCLLIGRIVAHYRFYYLPQSCASMLFGFVVGAMLTFGGPEESSYVAFNPSVFFFVLLPPIIFDAGYALKKKSFFQNLTTINLYAVLGTVVSTLCIGFPLYGLAKLGLVPLDSSSPLECLMFASLLSAVDPVATLAILGDENINADPLLYSLVFGESVLNDAVSIVLFKTFDNAIRVKESGELTALTLIGNFVSVSFGSIGVGVVVALLCCFLFKKNDLSKLPAYEYLLTFLFAYASYCASEIVGLSGIMALFFCGIVLSHYNYYNLSPIAKSSMKHIFHAMTLVAETFLFAYLGITAAVSLEPHFNLQWSLSLIFWTIILCFISRALNIFPFSYLANLRRRQKVTRSMQIVMWFAGLRGAIAFALALSMTTPSRSVIVTTTLVVVFFTTFVCGGLTERLLTVLELKASRPGFQPMASEPEHHEASGFHKMWKDFDAHYMRQWFGGPHDNRNPAGGEESLMMELIDNDFQEVAENSEREMKH